MLRYTLARKPLPTEDDNEETTLGPTLLYVTTEPGTGSPDTEIILQLQIPFHRRADVWAQQLTNEWEATGLLNLEEFRDWLFTTYGSEYMLALQVTATELSP